jgi:hypothetical protein
MTGTGTPPVVLVVGMHRSGTSMFARFLDASGIAMGERLHVDRRTNPYGHYEDEDFLALQRAEIARHFDGDDFLATRAFEPGDGFRAAATSLYRDRAAEARGPWGWKDPRTTVFLDFWREVVGDFHAVGLVRRPQGVLDSLSNRLRAYFRPALKERILASYAHYNRTLADFARRFPDRVTLLELEPLIEAPAAPLARLSERLGVELAAELFREQYDARAMNRSRRATTLFNRRALRDAEAARAEVLAATDPA